MTKWNVELDKELTCAMLKNFGKRSTNICRQYTLISARITATTITSMSGVQKDKILTPGMKFFINKKSLGKGHYGGF